MNEFSLRVLLLLLLFFSVLLAGISPMVFSVSISHSEAEGETTWWFFIFFDQLNPPDFHINVFAFFTWWRQHTGTWTHIDFNCIPSGIVWFIGGKKLLRRKFEKKRSLGSS